MNKRMMAIMLAAALLALPMGALADAAENDPAGDSESEIICEWEPSEVVEDTEAAMDTAEDEAQALPEEAGLADAGRIVQALSEDVQVRWAANGNSPALGVLYAGDYVPYGGSVSYDEEGVAWYSVSWHGREAWVCAREVSLY